MPDNNDTTTIGTPPKDDHHGQHDHGDHKDDPKENKKLRNLAMDYGWAMAVFEEFPELMKVFKDAVHNSWSVQRFQAEIQDTNWFKKHSDVWRTNTYLQLTDPKTFKERVQKVRRGMEDAAGQLGIDLNEHQLKEMSEQAFLHGWDETKINNVLARSVRITGTHEVGGELASIQDRLNNFALENGVVVSDKTMQTWLRSVVRGSGTEQEFQNYVTRQAVAKFPNWKKELEGGMTVAQIAEPYRRSMAELLEINPASINLNGKLLRTALSAKNDKGEWGSMTLGDFEDAVRRDPRWQYTDNARQQINGVTASLLQSFGQIA